MESDPQLKITMDGSHTLYVKELDEHYHSHFGAITESKHVFINAGLRAAIGNSINIFEMGFGTGLNAFLTLADVKGSGKSIHYTGLEKHPLGSKTYRSLNYSSLISDPGGDYFIPLHECPWDADITITKEFTLRKIEGDITSLEIIDQFDLVYYDAFGPDKQPELWTAEIFSRTYRSMRSGAILTTYSSKGQVRRNMEEAGFRIEKLAGPPGKRDMTRAWKDN